MIDGIAYISGDAIISQNGDYTTVSRFGWNNATITFFRMKDGKIGVCDGAFSGTLEELRQDLLGTSLKTKQGGEYLLLASLMEYTFALNN